MDLFSSLAGALAVPRSLGQIYGVLFASPAALSFSEIAERLEISRGSVSQGLVLLKNLGAINEVASNGGPGLGRSLEGAGSTTGDAQRSARARYEAELSLRRLFSGLLRERIAPLAAGGADRLKRLQDLAGSDPATAHFYLSRSRQLAGWRKRLGVIVPVLTSLLGPKGSVK